MTRSPATIDLTIYAGATFQQDFTYGCGEKVDITAVTLGATTTITAPRHGYQTGQVLTIRDIKGPDSLNSVVYTITVVDANNFTLDGIDTTGESNYLTGGYAIVPIDLTGYTAIMHIRSKQPSDEVILDLTTANGRITLGGTNGGITLEVAGGDTALLKKGKYVYDLKLISAGNIISRFIQGKIAIDAQVTR